MEKLDRKVTFLSVVIGAYVLLIGVGLPIIVRDMYFDILVVKYYFYCISTILMAVLVVGYFLAIGVRQNCLSIRGFFSKFILKNCTFIDYAVLAYFIIAVISTITSDYLYESFWGNEGRLTGLFLITWYVVSYFCVSRFLKFKSWYIDVILAAGMLVCLFGITDYFNLDIFHFKVAMVAEQRPIFTSTIGNINTYTAYVGILVAITTVLFTTDTKFKSILWHYFCMIIAFFSIIMGASDNAYLTLGALFGLLPLQIFKNKNAVKRYLIVVATFFSVIQCIDWINSLQGDKVLGLDGVFNMLVGFSGLHYLVILFWAFVIICNLFERKNKTTQREYGNLFIYIWISVIVLLVLTIFFVIYDCNIAGNANKYGSLSSYFIFNDNWGTHRGYIWRNAMECYFDLSNWKKIFGFGPETFGILVMRRTANNPYGEIFDSAHNEYLHILITVGIAGLFAYLSFLFTFIKHSLNKGKNNPYIIAVCFGVICYSTQALVNINLPIVAPILWLLMSIGSARSLEA